ncbi:MAG: patatin-like phospholipase family protein [Candidatus Methylophosphatis roskildensis]
MASPIRLGLALGSGSARGWAHIGVLRALAGEGVVPDVVCGCSIGSFVGAAYANDDLGKLESWVASLTRQDVLGLLDVRLRGGLIKGDKLMRFFSDHFVDHDFSDLPIALACVATDLQTGREVWLRDGSVADAVRASIALPGLFSPIRRDGQLLVDGGLVNPVPVSVARAMGADIVIAVDLGSDVVGRAWRSTVPKDSKAAPVWALPSMLARLGLADSKGQPEEDLPSLITVLSSAIQIMQVRIARSRLAGEPADVVIAPRVAGLGLMDYHRGVEAIAEGREAVARMLPAIRYVLGR